MISISVGKPVIIGAVLVAVLGAGGLIYKGIYDRGVAAQEQREEAVRASLEREAADYVERLERRAEEASSRVEELEDEARADPRAPERKPSDDELRRLRERFDRGRSRSGG